MYIKIDGVSQEILDNLKLEINGKVFAAQQIVIEPVEEVEAEPIEPVDEDDSDLIYSMKKFFGEARGSLFKGRMNQDQVNGCSLLFDTCLQAGLDPFIQQTAYVLATVFHETGTKMLPVRETYATSDAQAKARLESAWNRGRLPWVKKPYWRDGWFGRGYVQITHERNYLRMERKLADMEIVEEWGLDHRVHQNPDLMLTQGVSAVCSVYGMRDGDFTGKDLNDYINDDRTDYRNARRIINGVESAQKVATYADKFEDAVLAAFEK